MTKTCVICGKEFEAFRSAKACPGNCREEQKRAYDAGYHADYYAAHGEQIRAYQADYRATHREQKRAYNATYRKQKRTYDAAYNAAYNATHREQKRAYNAAYNAASRQLKTLFTAVALTTAINQQKEQNNEISNHDSNPQ